ncbi:MAG: XRE family transcriptional regulator [Candidatus Brocadiales bacterium]|nr:XRE family transcriptional regulator [Candidatus Bathyanammoxibius amoris]
MLYTFCMDIGDKIKKGRKELDLSQDQLAKKLSDIGLEMEQVTVSRIEGSARRVFAEEVEFFSMALQLTTEYLLNSKKGWPPSNGDRLPEAPPDIPGKIPLKQPETIGEGDTIPIISYVSAGDTEVAYGDAGYPAGEGIDRMVRPEGVTDQHAYGLIVKGDSMLPMMPDGTVVVAVTNKRAKEGNVVICRAKESGKVYIKLLKRLDHIVVLESTNMQAHDPLAFQREDIYFMHPVVCWNTTKIKE